MSFFIIDSVILGILSSKKKKSKKKIVYNNVEKQYNALLTIYFKQYNNIEDKEHMDK